MKVNKRYNGSIWNWLVLVCVIILFLSQLSGCSSRPSAASMAPAQVVTVTKIKAAPKVSLVAYSRCTMPEDLPTMMNDYPRYVEATANQLAQCNARNAAASNYDLALIKGEGDDGVQHALGW